MVLYCLGVIGTAKSTCDVDKKPMKRTFSGTVVRINYYRDTFDIQPDINLEQMMSDIEKSPMFSMCAMSCESNGIPEQLGVFYNSEHTYKWDKYVQSKYRILHRFFELSTDSIGLVGDKPDSPISEDSVRNLYTRLRTAQSDHRVSERIKADARPVGLKPELRAYQTKAVNWMLSRELDVEYFPSEFHQIQLKSSDLYPNKFYLNSRTLEFTHEWPGDVKIPSGGILADEMGLGKTVEILALILCNRRSNTVPVMGISISESTNHQCPESTVSLLCICANASTQNLIQCTVCLQHQHRCCVTRSTQAHESHDYKCPACWEESKQVIESNATFIVSPSSIKTQWAKEVEKHIADENVRLLVYNGVKSGWYSPLELSKYDIVLTDYTVLRAEFYFSEQRTRPTNMRQKRRYIHPKSPLTMVNWWRVCLDEAQMVEGTVKQASQVVKKLPAVHRWAVTGTPIEKSIDNLYGLLYFLGCDPYAQSDVWKQVSMEFHKENMEPVLQALRRIMWRTCKWTVQSEINVPPQTPILHMVDMCDLQAFFYTSEHNKCAAQFRHIAEKVGRSMLMSKMNTATLNKLMEPLRNLRQDCVVPVIIHRTTGGKRLLSPEELHTHMVGINETEAKSQLRTLVSSVNGMAAIFIIRNELDLAIKHYKHVLRWASDHTGNISVDSLLQVHALHNLLELLTPADSDEIERAKYKADLVRIESKYMNNCCELIYKTKTKKETAEGAIDKLFVKLKEPKLKWWLDFLYEHMNHTLEKSMIDRISAELASSLSDLERDKIRSKCGIALLLTTWLDELEAGRRKVQKAFSKLQFFAQNVNVRGSSDAALVESVDKFVQTALECHLDPKGLRGIEKRMHLDGMCELCLVKKQLLEYECVIFDKTMKSDDTTGTWNPAHQEVVLKVILSTLKGATSKSNVLVQDGDTHIALLDAMKNEYKEYSSYWVEVNYAAAALDELNMCKTRLTISNAAHYPTHSNLFVESSDVQYKLYEFQFDFNEAQTKFQRSLGTLKYLTHLGKHSAPTEMCPICTQVPTGKYTVLECGHLMCTVCLLQMQEQSPRPDTIECALCRHRQSSENVHHVNFKDSSNSNARGNYSQKILSIIDKVLELKKQDDSVKIIVFSQWDGVIVVLANALKLNDVTYRMKSNNIDKCISEFKNLDLNVTCLLLPLSAGSKGMNLTEATHVFLVEPILNPAEELQAIGRIHRIGQTRPTFVHRFIVRNSIEEKIYKTIKNDESGKWNSTTITVENLQELFN